MRSNDESLYTIKNNICFILSFLRIDDTCMFHKTNYKTSKAATGGPINPIQDKGDKKPLLLPDFPL